MEITVDEDVCLWNHQRRPVETVGGAYGHEVAMDDVHRVQVLQSANRFCELRRYISVRELGEVQGSGLLNEGG